MYLVSSYIQQIPFTSIKYISARDGAGLRAPNVPAGAVERRLEVRLGHDLLSCSFVILCI